MRLAVHTIQVCTSCPGMHAAPLGLSFLRLSPRVFSMYLYHLEGQHVIHKRYVGQFGSRTLVL